MNSPLLPSLNHQTNESVWCNRQNVVKPGYQVTILAGGLATRTNGLGRFLPKSMLPVSDQETCLTRQLSQLVTAGYRNIVVSTSPAQYALLQCFLARVVESLWSDDLRGELCLEVFSNVAHDEGPLPALAEALVAYPSGNHLISLADIVYASNPFVDCFLGNNSASNLLLVGPRIPGRGGLVSRQDERVRRLWYSIEQEPDCQSGAEFNWTGAVCLSEKTCAAIIDFGRIAKNRPLEDAVNHVLDAGCNIIYRNVGAFINVNTIRDLAHCRRMLRRVKANEAWKV